jgi:TRAP-type C4-dicarboxylate transport system substrate-binding protein
MKKITAILLTVMLALSLFACGTPEAGPAPDSAGESPSSATSSAPASTSSAPASEPADDTVYTLKVHQHDSATSGIGLFLEDWSKKITEESNGRIVFEIYHGGTLGSAKDTIDMIQSGVCDIGWGLHSYFTGEFDASQVVMCPMLGIEDATQGSKVIWNLYKTNPEVAAEYEGFHVLMLHTSLNSPISTKDTQITSIDQFKGMNIRCQSGAPTSFVKNLGAAPVNVAIGELYQAIENNTIDALITDWQANKAFSLYEPQKFYLDECTHVTSYFFLMNQASYDKLPADLQAILDANSGDAAVEIVGSYWMPFQEECQQLIQDNGGTIYKLSDEDRAKMQAVADLTCEQWAEEISQRGYDGQKLLEDCRNLVETYS